jgi:hypothetical protein
VPDTPKRYTIGLIWGTLGQYQVKTITNSTEFKPGEWLSVAQVDGLCKRPDWQVSIADDQLLTQLLGLAVSHIPIPAL